MGASSNLVFHRDGYKMRSKSKTDDRSSSDETITADNGNVGESRPMVESALALSPVVLLTVMLQLMQTMHEDRNKDKEREDLFFRQLQWQQNIAMSSARIDAVARFPDITKMTQKSIWKTVYELQEWMMRIGSYHSSPN